MGNCLHRDVTKAITSRSRLLILVIGGPCTGKSTICQHLSNHFQLLHISPNKLIQECVDQEHLRKPELRLERLHRRRTRTYDAMLIHNKMTKEEKEFLGKGGVRSSFNHFPLHRQSDSEDDYCHPVVRDLQTSLKHGDPINPDAITTLVHEAMWHSLRKCNGFVVDGYPRDSDQFEALSQAIGDPHVILFLDCPEKLMIERALARAEAAQRHDDNEPFLKMKIRAFYRNLADLTEIYTSRDIDILNVNATGDLESVKNDCVLQIQNKISGRFRIVRFRDWRAEGSKEEQNRRGSREIFRGSNETQRGSREAQRGSDEVQKGSAKTLATRRASHKQEASHEMQLHWKCDAAQKVGSNGVSSELLPHKLPELSNDKQGRLKRNA